MKKLVTLLLAAGLVFSAASNASAVDVKVSGQWDTAFDWQGNAYPGSTAFYDYDDVWANAGERYNQKHFAALQRMRFTVDFVMSENLSATYQAQVGLFTWGGPSNPGSAMGGNSAETTGGRYGSRAANIVTRLAYLDWIIPNTSVKVRMGQQPVALPGATFGSPVMGGGDTATGIVVSAPITDNVAVNAMWLRGDSGFRRGGGVDFTDDFSDTADIFALVGDLKFDGVRVQPWAMVGLIGKDSEKWGTRQSWFGVNATPAQYKWQPRLRGSNYGDATAWWLGLSADLTMFDPFRLTADFVYSNVSVENNTYFNTLTGSWVRDDTVESAGWYMALGAEYKTAYGTPALKGWYASGDDRNWSSTGIPGTYYVVNKKSGRLFALGGNFNPTGMLFDGGNFPFAGVMDATTPNGSWGISAQWNNISFIEDLTHSLSVTYVQGTNHKSNFIDPGAAYLTTEDSLVEIDLTTKYNIYKNLAAVLDLGYIFQDFDGKNAARNYRGIRGLAYDGSEAKFSNAWHATLIFQYRF